MLLPIVVSAQTQNQSTAITEDRVRVIVNEQSQIIEKHLGDLQQKQLKVYQQEFVNRAKAVELKLNILIWGVPILIFLFGSGIFFKYRNAIKDLKEDFYEKVENETRFAVFRFDPRKWPINIPSKNFKAETKRLEGLQYVDLKSYEGLDFNWKNGITVYRANSDDDLKKLQKLLIEKEIDPLKCCFVIYYTGSGRLNTQLLEPFDNYVLSNMPGTLSGQIFSASRNIIHE